MTENLTPILETFIEDARLNLEARWAAWQIDLSRNEIHEVVGGLLARQVSLATEMARNPEIWNAHIGPLILRTMVDVHISLSWILMKPEERSRQFIAYGLGQIKLRVEQIRKATSGGQPNLENQTVINTLEEWLNLQRWIFLTDVNVGNWSGLNTRKMAEESGCLDLYRGAYATFSEAAHSMWHHISIFNLKRCENPLHRRHSVPDTPKLEPQFDYLHAAVKYLDMTFELSDEKLGLQVEQASASCKLWEGLGSLLDGIRDSR